MGKIQLLESKISNMIAAGEVVERPAGVIKELVENSIDAQSTRIEIHVEQGGTSFLEVIDNGCGMNREDALLALERHATSKIRSEHDLWNIKTLGFRGEALPSIASVSDVVLRTCDGEESTIIEISSSELKQISMGTLRKGTQVRVENLFYTLPARLKHLKSIPYEFSLILDLVQKLALVNAKIAFLVTHDGKEVFRTNGSGDMLQIIYAIYGRDVAKSAIPLRGGDDDFELGGYLCLPHINRSNRYHMVTFMNERLVKAYKIQQAILDGYRDVMSDRRYPMVFLMINLDSKLIDVNVHPSKWEVRLSKEIQLGQLITATIKDSLTQNLYQAADLLSDEKANHGSEERLVSESNTSSKQLQWPISRNYKEDYAKPSEVVSLYSLQPLLMNNSLDSVEPLSTAFNNDSGANGDNNDEIVDKTAEIVDKIAETVENYGISLDYDIIGQLHASYILCQDENGLVIVDQHAANERIRYEEVKAILESQQILTQPLLFPLVLEVDRQTVLRLPEIAEALHHIGIVLDVFGEKELLCRELPLWVNVDNEEQFLLDVIELMLDQVKKGLAEFNQDALATLACHTSVRFNRVLSLEEMRVLLQRLFACHNPYHCPHGRPTLVHYDSMKLKKLFDRG